jgi:hypothetical protein
LGEKIMDNAKAIIDYAMQDNGTGVRDAYTACIQDRVTGTY